MGVVRHIMVSFIIEFNSTLKKWEKQKEMRRLRIYWYSKKCVWRVLKKAWVIQFMSLSPEKSIEKYEAWYHRPCCSLDLHLCICMLKILASVIGGIWEEKVIGKEPLWLGLGSSWMRLGRAHWVPFLMEDWAGCESVTILTFDSPDPHGTVGNKFPLFINHQRLRHFMKESTFPVFFSYDIMYEWMATCCWE